MVETMDLRSNYAPSFCHSSVLIAADEALTPDQRKVSMTPGHALANILVLILLSATQSVLATNCEDTLADWVRTPRTLLKPMSPADDQRILDILQMPRVTQMQRRQVTAASFASRKNSPFSKDRLEYTAWVNDRIVGSIQISRVTKRYVNIWPLPLAYYFEKWVEFGYVLEPEAWGQGLGTEVAEAAVRIAQTKFHSKRLLATVALKNSASQKVLTKLGFLPFARSDDEIVYSRPIR
jgi:RimJ/RimL family protein N-acetyltransferase